MLADITRQFPDTDLCWGLPLVQQKSHQVMAEKVQGAHRFLLRRDAVHMIHTISEAKPNRFLQALAICRLPFPLLWVEFPYSDRQTWIDSIAERGINVVSRDRASPPKLLGFLFEQMDDAGRIAQVHLVWTHHGHEVSLCYKSLQINCDPNWRPSEKSLDLIREGVRARLASNDHGNSMFNRQVRNSAVEFEAAVELQARIEYVIPDYQRPVWEAIARLNPVAIREMEDMATFDLRAEWRFVLALLIAQNSRNFLEQGEEVTFERLNRQRLKNSKAPLLSYRPIMLSLSRFQKRYANATGRTISRELLEAHFVIGHMKVRRTGVFWWSPHERGAHGEARVRTYDVRA